MDNHQSAPHRQSILVVDDTPENLTLMSILLRDLYKVRVATNGERALQIAVSPNPPDLILLDIMMPVVDGYEICRRLQANPISKNIPIIFLTAKAEIVDEERGLQLGAVDYITKPISPPIVLARVKNHLQLKAATDFLNDKNVFLEQEIANRTQEIRAIQDVTIFAMAALAETRDTETGNHIQRTQLYVQTLALKLQQHPRFSAILTDPFIESIVKAAPLHDIGKVGIPDNILLKPGRLTSDEFEIMKTHTTIGRDAIENAERKIGINVDFLRFSKEIAYGHHEKWDCSGYPQGIGRDAIPVSARIMAIADVYDAITMRRVYKEAMPAEMAVTIIVEGRNQHFDPDMVDVFLEIQDEFKKIAMRYQGE